METAFRTVLNMGIAPQVSRKSREKNLLRNYVSFPTCDIESD